MNATTFISPLGDGIGRFLQYKRATGCKYQTSEQELCCLDRFLDSHLTAKNPAITLDVVRAYLARGGERSETTRENQLSLIRQLCRFLAVEDSRNEIPPRKFFGIRRRPYIQRILSREEGKRLHDLRGTFAVHRLLLWYEQDANLDTKLPLLSTYLGHVGLASSQRYLQMTKELVGEVTRRQEARFGYLIKDLKEGTHT